MDALSDTFSTIPCQATDKLAIIAFEGLNRSQISGFRPALSYFEFRSIQEEIGLLSQNDQGKWQCTRPMNLFDGITCPEGFYKVSQRGMKVVITKPFDPN